MSDELTLGTGPAVSLYLRLDPGGTGQQRQRLTEWLRTALPQSNWRTQVHVLGGGLFCDPRGMHGIAATLAHHLHRYPFTAATLRPVVFLEKDGLAGDAFWQSLATAARPFQREAYNEQGEARLVMAPILVVSQGAVIGKVLSLVAALRRDLFEPSLLVAGDPPAELVRAMDGAGLEVDVLPGPVVDVGSLMCWLRACHVFESLRERIDEAGADLLAPCLGHTIIDERVGTFFACFKTWERWARRPLAGFDPSELAGDDAAVECSGCIHAAVLARTDSLVFGRERPEAARICSELGLAFGRRGSYRLGASLAHRAYEAAETDADRAPALIQQGLSHLAGGDLARAEEALALAAGLAPNPGLVAYHRGRVQLAWRDEIEALEHFEEALNHPSAAVASAELHLLMAMSHSNLAEYDDTRRHLEHVDDPELAAPAAFYAGLADLNEGRPQEALRRFRQALDAGPSPEDLSRVLLYQATALKELGRFEDAIPILLRAAEVDPDELAVHNLLGFCYYSLQRHEDAVRCFLRAVEIDPGSAIDWANLGSNLRDLGRTDDAIMMYRKALSLDPTIGFASAGLARLTAGREHAGDGDSSAPS